MLEFLRNHVGGFVGFALIGALVFAFALSFGSQSAGWGQGQDEYVAAKVQGVTISEATYKCAFNLVGGRNLATNSAEYHQLKKATIDGLIERQLLLNLAAKSGISASKEQAEDNVIKSELYLSTAIETHAERLASMFYIDASMASRELLEGAYKVRQSFLDEDGKLEYEQMQKYIRHHLQVTEENFVEEQRKELIAMRMRKLLVAGIRVSEQEVRDEYERDNNTASISYIKLFPTYFSDRLDPTPEEMQAWTAANGEAISQYYETNKYKYTNLEKMARARHILVKVAQDATDEEKAKSRTDIEAIELRIKTGEDFATLARQFSEDPGSGANGGDLGYNPRGRMVPEFDEAMFTLEPGAVSGIVESKFGFHIIKLLGFREGNITLEEATEEIADKLFREEEGKKRAEISANEYLARLKGGDSIDTLLPQEDDSHGNLKLRVNTSSPFSKSVDSIPGIGSAPDIVTTAFAFTKEAPVPDKIFEVRGDYFVITLNERVVPNDNDFSDKKDELLEKLLVVKQATWLRQRMKELRTQAEKAGEIENAIVTAGTTQGDVPDFDPKDLGNDEKETPEARDDEAKKDGPADEVDEEPSEDADEEPAEVNDPAAEAETEPEAEAKPEVEAEAEPEPAEVTPAPAEAKPAPAEPKPKPVEPKPKPVEPKPKPAEAKPVPAEAKPAPVEPKPAPAEPKPKPAEKKPESPDVSDDPYGD